MNTDNQTASELLCVTVIVTVIVRDRNPLHHISLQEDDCEGAQFNKVYHFNRCVKYYFQVDAINIVIVIVIVSPHLFCEQLNFPDE